ncbi:thiamine pyrophosphate-dependent dehydrogenase E1 component subunit alpha [Kocuria tytonis]|uniref:2-oxoisovalerate dehydrogenase subunit alpha n=1 Tax=Kocuria tytonis TaxID=2054280 RepID=A0A495A590_9MICC|nr:thiamine pyrophosphate-dependent dehydrogenase E1 component subunit alpha [Kocuria tytonis]RKQ34879.1 thiamine pyrophosphate-dependent dehydrogenase E1 component subunit alpha [Kocuria tytonis]
MKSVEGPRSTMESRSHAGAVPSTLTRHQLLDEQGVVAEDPLLSPYAADITVEELQHLYRSMTLARRVDEEGTSLQRQGQLVLWVPLRGQEAAQVGSVWPTHPSDRIYPSYREHAVAFERGVPPAELMRYFRGLSAGGWDPEQYNLNPYTVVLGSQTLHAVGYAMGASLDRKAAEDSGSPLDGDPEAVIAYFGDGASTEGEVHEAMVFAASYDAPVLFFIQNNQWAISVPFATQSRVPLATRAAGYGFEGLRVDGNDILGVVAATRYALEKLRRGEGPVLIEAETYRMGAHTTADDPTKYREREEEDQWGHLDPIERLRVHLRTVHCVDQAFFDTVAAENDAVARQMRADVLAMSPPEFVDRFDGVYAEPHSLVAAERAEYLDYQAGFVAQDDSQDSDSEGVGA